MEVDDNTQGLLIFVDGIDDVLHIPFLFEVGEFFKRNPERFPDALDLDLHHPNEDVPSRQNIKIPVSC